MLCVGGAGSSGGSLHVAILDDLNRDGIWELDIVLDAIVLDHAVDVTKLLLELFSCTTLSEMPPPLKINALFNMDMFLLHESL
jgi:hypothetical protein